VVRRGRLAAALAVALACAIGLCALAARAQALQRLTVQSFALNADTGAPRVDIPFHLVVTLRVRQRVARIDNLELPMLAELELLGDERRLQSGPQGTLYSEIVTVVAHHGGTLTIGPALLQAVDARDRRAKQYSTNGLTLQIAGAPPSFGGVEEAAQRFSSAAFRLALIAFGIACAIAVIGFVVVRRRSPVAAVVEDVPYEPIASRPPRSMDDELRDALRVLRAEPSQANAVLVRALVWNMLGADAGRTLTDVLQCPEASEPAMRDVLRALERAAFTYAGDVPAALDNARGALERYLEVRAI